MNACTVEQYLASEYVDSIENRHLMFAGRSQFLFLLTWLCRYSDLVFTFSVSLFVTSVKVFYISTSVVTVALVYAVGRTKDERTLQYDTFR